MPIIAIDTSRSAASRKIIQARYRVDIRGQIRTLTELQKRPQLQLVFKQSNRKCPDLSFFAHSKQDCPPEDWEPLEVHLHEVAALAGDYASSLGVPSWGRLAGLWHDLGKFSPQFQAYLNMENGIEAHLEQYQGRVDHSTAGAQHAVAELPQFGRLMAYLLAGHHAGLPDAVDLDERLAKEVPDWSAAPEELLTTADLALADFKIGPDRKRASFQLAFFTRMLFSCLVDADFLATERFMSPERAVERPQDLPTLRAIAVALGEYLHELTDSARASNVNDSRRLVLDACEQAASQVQGFFSLTVPTGGGKTLSSLQFAVQHALQHNLTRVIYAIPFTTIVEQTVEVFRQALGPLGEKGIVEHHSYIDPELETPLNRLMSENWQAPLVVSVLPASVPDFFLRRR